MKQIKWFERKFDFSFEQNIFPSIIERLEGTPILLENKVNNMSIKQLTNKETENGPYKKILAI